MDINPNDLTQAFHDRVNAEVFDRLVPGKTYTPDALSALRADVEFELTGGVEVIADPVSA